MSEWFESLWDIVCLNDNELKSLSFYDILFAICKHEFQIQFFNDNFLYQLKFYWHFELSVLTGDMPVLVEIMAWYQ